MLRAAIVQGLRSLYESELISAVDPFASAGPVASLALVAWVVLGPLTAAALTVRLDLSRLSAARPTVTTPRRVGAAIVGAQVAIAIVTVSARDRFVLPDDRCSYLPWGR